MPAHTDRRTRRNPCQSPSGGSPQRTCLARAREAQKTVVPVGVWRMTTSPGGVRIFPSARARVWQPRWCRWLPSAHRSAHDFVRLAASRPSHGRRAAAVRSRLFPAPRGAAAARAPWHGHHRGGMDLVGLNGICAGSTISGVYARHTRATCGSPRRQPGDPGFYRRSRQTCPDESTPGTPRPCSGAIDSAAT